MADNSGGSSASVLTSSLDDGWFAINSQTAPHGLATTLYSLAIQLSSLYNLIMDCVEDTTSNSSSSVARIFVAVIHVYLAMETCLVWRCLAVDNFSVIMLKYF
jgi:hypothetical protein